ncbi:hypothetical protein [Phenylobacterium sp.]|uniref:hypothetical protein n=1 Tax=Phenylobacterium sp. TaxID=1871053 RepID=UPI0025D1DFD7|nr:hypothetical protein [Phenylobacterium sp.]MBX3482524.1 hypothetical protein [Phenylobacterium sp.]
MTRRGLTPDEADYDDMHHALGRPPGRWVEPFRNHFCCPAEGPEAERFETLGSYWRKVGLINGGADAIYRVTPHGVRQVMAWLALRDRAAGRRAWRVFGGGVSERVVVAKSASQAKYFVYLDLNDVWNCGFRAFCGRGVKARLAHG